MSAVPEPLEILFEVRLDLRLGISLSSALDRATSTEGGRFRKALRTWLIRTEAGHEQEQILTMLSVVKDCLAHRCLIRIFERGLKGISVDPSLAELENEFFSMTEYSFERRLQLLPLKLLVPLTLFILPGMMLLILGPVMYRLAAGF